MYFLQAINSDISVRIVCNKTGGTMKGDIKKYISINPYHSPAVPYVAVAQHIRHT